MCREQEKLTLVDVANDVERRYRMGDDRIEFQDVREAWEKCKIGRSILDQWIYSSSSNDTNETTDSYLSTSVGCLNNPQHFSL